MDRRCVAGDPRCEVDAGRLGKLVFWAMADLVRDVDGSVDEVDLVARLRSGDETAFCYLVDRYHVSMVRLARSFVSTDAAAEDVAQDTWMGAMRGVDRFEGRSSVKTWLFRILVNRAKTRGVRDSRSVPFSSLGDDGEHAVDPDRFLEESHRWGGYWSAPPSRWRDGPELKAIGAETRKMLGRALDELPPMQKAVVTLRDVHGFETGEVCDALDVSEANQRVLLHRGRSRMRTVLEVDFRASGAGS